MTTTAGVPTAARAAPGARVRLGPGLLIAVFSAATFGLSGSLAHALLDIGWTPTAVVSVRIVGAFLVLVGPCLVLLRRQGLPTGRQWRRMALYGLVAVAGAQLCFFSAVQYLDVGVALLLEYLAPVLLIGYHWVRDRRRPAVPVLVGAALAMAGLVFVLDVRNGLTLNPVGVAYGLAAAVCLAAYFVLSTETGDARPVSPLLLTTVGTGVGGLVLVVAGTVGLLPVRMRFVDTALGGVSVSWWVPAALVVTVSAVIAYLTGIVAVRRLGTSLASFVALTEVVFAVVFAAVLLGQRPGPSQLLGGLLILAGIGAVQLGPSLRHAQAGGRELARRMQPKIRR